MTFAPAALTALAAYWKDHGGASLGVVGDAAHAGKGTSYHLGKSQLLAHAYSADTARDKAGLSEAASAIDLGRLNGTLGDLWTFSQWFAKECMAHHATAPWRDVREVIFWSPGRNCVVGWSSLSPDALINNYGDLSHKTHTHISFYRDSEARPKVPIFAPYFPEVAVNSYPVPKQPSLGTVAKGKVLYTTDALASTDPGRITVDPAREMPYHGKPGADLVVVEYVNDKGVHSGKAYFMHAADLTGIRTVPVAVADCVEAIAAAVAPLNTTIAELQAGIGTAKLEGARAEWERQSATAVIGVRLAPKP